MNKHILNHKHYLMVTVPVDCDVNPMVIELAVTLSEHLDTIEMIFQLRSVSISGFCALFTGVTNFFFFH